MLGNTPMMRQYKEIKNQYPDTILFYRLGDFYEMFGPDALLASRVLEITLTGRDAGLEERVPMCGVPHHAADNYITKLIQKGYKVAVCEQVEDPRAAKGIVKREVIRVITPGTALDLQTIQNQQTNILAAICHLNHIWGLAACDASTGDFWVTEFSGLAGLGAIKDELNRLCPVEVLIPAGSGPYTELFSPLDLPVITPFKREAFSFNNAHKEVLEHFKVKSLEVFGIIDTRAAISSAGAILTYLKETQKLPPHQIKNIHYFTADSFLAIDSTTFRNLEIVRTSRMNDKKGSLFDVMDKTRTASGSRLLRQWLEKPLTDCKALEDRYTAVEAVSAQWSQRKELQNYLDQVYDLERLMTRILYKRALPKELIALKHSLAVLKPVKELVLQLECSTLLAHICEAMDTLEDLTALLNYSLEEEPPFNIKEGGVIKEGYNEEVDSLRVASKDGKTWIARLESQEKEKTGIKSLKVGYNKVFGYYLEVTKANISLVPDYYQRKQTLANGERYVTEDLLKLESQVLGAEEKLVALEEELYYDLLGKIGLLAGRVKTTSQILAQLDVIQSMAELAVQNSYTRPKLLEKEANNLLLEDLRHPVVERLTSGTAYVPNDLAMTKDINMYIVTGPNMGGKSTYCRSAALAVIMAQAGSFVPANKAVISIRDRVFARVGASDDLGSGQSTFMVEMNEVANILNNATPYSLIILDEVGRGTSTYDGLSMAWAVSEYLVNQVGGMTLFATHYHELTQLESLYSSIRNTSVSVKEKGEEIIFLHKIVEGPADKSYGIQVGRLAGLPISVISRARAILGILESEHLNREIQPGEFPEDFNSSQDEHSFRLFQEELQRILELKLDTMSPLEALNSLYELKERLSHLSRSLAAK